MDATEIKIHEVLFRNTVEGAIRHYALNPLPDEENEPATVEINSELIRAIACLLVNIDADQKLSFLRMLENGSAKPKGLRSILKMAKLYSRLRMAGHSI